MNTLDESDLLDGAEEWLDAARANLEGGRLHAAFESARTAAELASKVLLLRASGSYPKEHDVSGHLYRARISPEGVPLKDLHKLLSEISLGSYGCDRSVSRKEAQQAIRLAQRMVEACRVRR